MHSYSSSGSFALASSAQWVECHYGHAQVEDTHSLSLPTFFSSQKKKKQKCALELSWNSYKLQITICFCFITTNDDDNNKKKENRIFIHFKVETKTKSKCLFFSLPLSKKISRPCFKFLYTAVSTFSLV